jgi:hypothetical protein
MEYGFEKLVENAYLCGSKFRPAFGWPGALGLRLVVFETLDQLNLLGVLGGDAAVGEDGGVQAAGGYIAGIEGYGRLQVFTGFG